MTLTKAIEAEREANEITINLNRFKRVVRRIPDGYDTACDPYDVGWNDAVSKIETDYVTEVTLKLAWEKRAYQAEKELADIKAALPAEPMTEEELCIFLMNGVFKEATKEDYPTVYFAARLTIRALKDANVLYVKED